LQHFREFNGCTEVCHRVLAVKGWNADSQPKSQVGHRMADCPEQITGPNHENGFRSRYSAILDAQKKENWR